MKVAQKKMRASGASFCHMGVGTKPADKGAMLRDAWTCRGMHDANRQKIGLGACTILRLSASQQYSCIGSKFGGVKETLACLWCGRPLQGFSYASVSALLLTLRD